MTILRYSSSDKEYHLNLNLFKLKRGGREIRFILKQHNDNQLMGKNLQISLSPPVTLCWISVHRKYIFIKLLCVCILRNIEYLIDKNNSKLTN